MQKLADEIDHWDLSVVVLVLGDEDYGFRITALLDGGIAVRVVGAEFSPHVAHRYRSLTEEREQYCLSEGRDTSDFFVDGLESILSDGNPPPTNVGDSTGIV